MIKVMRLTEIRQAGEEKLRRQLSHLRAELRQKRFAVSAQQERNVASVSALRKSIARILTELSARDRARKE